MILLDFFRENITGNIIKVTEGIEYTDEQYLNDPLYIMYQETENRLTEARYLKLLQKKYLFIKSSVKGELCD